LLKIIHGKLYTNTNYNWIGIWYLCISLVQTINDAYSALCELVLFNMFINPYFLIINYKNAYFSINFETKIKHNQFLRIINIYNIQ